MRCPSILQCTSCEARERFEYCKNMPLIWRKWQKRLYILFVDFDTKNWNTINYFTAHWSKRFYAWPDETARFQHEKAVLRCNISWHHLFWINDKTPLPRSLKILKRATAQSAEHRFVHANGAATNARSIRKIKLGGVPSVRNDRKCASILVCHLHFSKYSTKHTECRNSYKFENGMQT